MAGKRKQLKNGVVVKTHRELSKITEVELRTNAAALLRDADQGIQTAIMSKDGKTIRAVAGLNGIRYLPDPDPDPLDDIFKEVLESSKDRGQ